MFLSAGSESLSAQKPALLTFPRRSGRHQPRCLFAGKYGRLGPIRLPFIAWKNSKQSCGYGFEAGSNGERGTLKDTVPSPVKLVVFDWDGTVVDSIDHIVESWSLTLRDWAAQRGDEREIEGLKSCGVPTPDSLRRCIGLSISAAITLLIPDATSKDRHLITELYRNYFRTGIV